MSTRHLAELIGKIIMLNDLRTGGTYAAIVEDTRMSFGKLQIKAKAIGQALPDDFGSLKWFEPTGSEEKSVR